jgi:hypothetical protein
VVASVRRDKLGPRVTVGSTQEDTTQTLNADGEYGLIIEKLPASGPQGMQL